MIVKAKKNHFVLSLGGSIIAPKEGIDAKFLAGFRRLILSQVRRGCRFIIVCGGGFVCRNYQAAASRVRPGVSHDELDLIGIAVSVLNANLVRHVFGAAAGGVVTDPRPPLPARSIVLAAGWRPGCSTDYDAVLLAKKSGATTVVNLSNIAYVYDRDPRRHADAKPLPNLTWAEFRRQFGSKWTPGLNSPFDPKAARAAERAGLRVIIADGRDLKNLGRILKGDRFAGTVIS